MNLFIDIGNTSIKFHFQKGVKRFYFYFDTKFKGDHNDLWEDLPNSLQDNPFTQIWLVAVVPSVQAIVVKMCEVFWKLKPKVLDHTCRGLLKLAPSHNQAAAVGPDLIALGNYVLSQTKHRAVMVNFGTATTITLIDHQTLSGAIIAPGVGISLKMLLAKAALVKKVELEVSKSIVIGTNTQEAVALGILKGQAKMVEGLLHDIITRETEVFVSGGYAKQVSKFLDLSHTLVKEATLEGLKLVGSLND